MQQQYKRFLTDSFFSLASFYFFSLVLLLLPTPSIHG
jgi:hypothetical protein